MYFPCTVSHTCVPLTYAWAAQLEYRRHSILASIRPDLLSTDQEGAEHVVNEDRLVEGQFDRTAHVCDDRRRCMTRNVFVGDRDEPGHRVVLVTLVLHTNPARRGATRIVPDQRELRIHAIASGISS